MARQVAIVHGWSDNSSSFKPLAAFLKDNGFKAVPIWLGDYISMDDDVKVEDVAKRMQQVIQQKMKDEGLADSFDMIVHSTGGLVARQWLSIYYPDGKGCPVRRLVMLAPANFGSKLASMGQSMLGRVVKGWNNWFHTGKEMLTALELGSHFQWELAQRDLFVPEGQSAAPSPYGTPGVLPFVIIGTHPYTSALRQMVNENGADGTVRVPAANLNVRGVTVDFAADEKNPAITNWKLRHDDLMFPFAVLPDRTHGSIVTPEDNEIKSNDAAQALDGQLILEALNCEGLAQYRQIQSKWDDISEATAELASDETKRDAFFPRRLVLDFMKGDESAEFFHQYLQVVVHVVDDHGADVPDFFLEFFGPDKETKSSREAVYFQTQVLEEVHPNGPRRCFYADRTDLMAGYYPLIGQGNPKELAMSLSVADPGDNTCYFGKKGAAGYLVIHREDDEKNRWLRRNCTHFVKIIIPRTPGDGVFKLNKYSA